MARRLKVFQAQFGFYDTVVAASSQTAALRAWGARQNLFASGEATRVSDPSAVAAALEHPETPLRRAVGTLDPFQLEPTGLPTVPDAPKRQASARRKTRPASEARAADRGALDAAEAALSKLDVGRKRQEADFKRRQDELDAARDRGQADYLKARKATKAALVEARQAFRKAGGEA